MENKITLILLKALLDKGFRIWHQSCLMLYNRKPRLMKTSIQNNDRYNSEGHPKATLSVKDAILWFVITVAALCLAGTSKAVVTPDNNTCNSITQ